MGYGIAPNFSHFTGKTRSKRKHLRTYKPKKTHKNKYFKFSRCGIKKRKGDLWEKAVLYTDGSG